MRLMRFSLPHILVSLQRINTMWGIIEKLVQNNDMCKSLSMKKTLHISSSKQVLVRCDYYRVPLDTSHMEGWCLLISVTFVVLALHCQSLVCGCGRSWDIMCEEEDTTCEIVGLLFFSLSSLMCLLMKGLKAAVALLKQEIVVSDKLWKKRQCKNRGSEGQQECLIFLSAEDTHREEDSLLGDTGDYQKHFVFHVCDCTRNTREIKTQERCSLFKIFMGKCDIW